MDIPLNASANNASVLFSNNTFEIPKYQREYSWGIDEVRDFWNDLKNNIDSESYFLGLIILTRPPEDSSSRKHVVDGQQRIITLSLLAKAIYQEAQNRDRKALAERVQANFLHAMDYESDAQVPRVKLSDDDDDKTFQNIISIASGVWRDLDPESVSSKIMKSYEFFIKNLKEDLAGDPFKRLGKWVDFLTNYLYFAVFVHPDSASAYQVFEVINTRGKDLTTADLLKNYVLSESSKTQQNILYKRWQDISKQFSTDGGNNLVQFIRHAITARHGHVLPKDLFDFIAGRPKADDRKAIPPEKLLQILEDDLPLYLQMIDPTSAGPADNNALGVFSALESLGVIAVRPILLACAKCNDPVSGMRYILQLVVRRIVVGHLGTGNVERKFGEAAKAINNTGDWISMIKVLEDLNPNKEEFVSQLERRSLNKQVLYLIRRSIIQQSITPHTTGFLHFIWTKQAPFDGMTEEEGLFWMSTIGNTLLSSLDRRPRSINSWDTFKTEMLIQALDNEEIGYLSNLNTWEAYIVQKTGEELAQRAGEIWF